MKGFQGQEEKVAATSPSSGPSTSMSSPTHKLRAFDPTQSPCDPQTIQASLTAIKNTALRQERANCEIKIQEKHKKYSEQCNSQYQEKLREKEEKYLIGSQKCEKDMLKVIRESRFRKEKYQETSFENERLIRENERLEEELKRYNTNTNTTNTTSKNLPTRLSTCQSKLTTQTKTIQNYNSTNSILSSKITKLKSTIDQYQSNLNQSVNEKNKMERKSNIVKNKLKSCRVELEDVTRQLEEQEQEEKLKEQENFAFPTPQSIIFSEEMQYPFTTESSSPKPIIEAQTTLKNSYKQNPELQQIDRLNFSPENTANCRLNGCNNTNFLIPFLTSLFFNFIIIILVMVYCKVGKSKKGRSSGACCYFGSTGRS